MDDEREVSRLSFSAKAGCSAPGSAERAHAVRAPQGPPSEKGKTGSPLMAVLALMLCCAVLLSAVAFEPPAVSAMAGAEGTGVTTTEDILGRLKFLGEELISVFSSDEGLAAPVSGSVAQSVDPDGTIEFVGESGCDVFAAADGVVTSVTLEENGWQVVLDHGGGAESTYGLLDEPVVEKWQQVRKGEALAASPTGRLRFCYMIDGAVQNVGEQFGVTVN